MLNGSDGSRRGIVSVGRVYCDLVFTGLPGLPQAGRELFADGLTVTAGGGAYITAATLAQLGRPSLLAAWLPGGPFGALLAEEIAASGVDTAHLEQGHAAEPQLSASMAVGGDRALVTRRVGPPVSGRLEQALAAPGVAHLHIGELTTLLERPDLIRLARSRGLTVSLDCAWDADVFADPRAGELIRSVDLFLPNQAEISALAGIAETDHAQAAADLAQAGPCVAVKCGGDGAVAFADGVAAQVPAPKVEVVDTTGAGDAFNAGFLDAWLAGQGLAACLGRGVGCGSRAVTHSGGVVRPVPAGAPPLSLVGGD